MQSYFVDYMYKDLERRIQNLENKILSGEIGGCESGVLGPLTNRQPFGVVRFRGYFMTPPTISLALSDLTQVDATKLMNFAIRPTQISSTTASVSLLDFNDNVGSVYVGYMACPSNNNLLVPRKEEKTLLSSPAAYKPPLTTLDPMLWMWMSGLNPVR